MFQRHLLPLLTDELQHTPAVALLGPRQSGKTTLALEASRTIASIYLDLESERDRAKLAQPELYLADHLDKLVILDEVHRAPHLFPVLRGLIDQARRSGWRRTVKLRCWGCSRSQLRRLFWVKSRSSLPATV